MFYQGHLTKLEEKKRMIKSDELFHNYILVYNLIIANIKCYFKLLKKFKTNTLSGHIVESRVNG